MKFIFFIALTSLCAPDVSASAQARNDDVDLQSLMTLVQQQAAVIQRQEAVIQTMHTSISDLQNSVANLSSELRHVTQRQNTQVYFVAQLTATPYTIGTSSPIRFDKVLTNNGAAYNPSSGIFTAPVSGVYVFYAQLMKHYNKGYLHYVIEHEGREVCENSLDSAADYDKSSCLTVVSVQKGEQAFVKRKLAGYELEGNVWCSFTGFLLSPDI